VTFIQRFGGAMNLNLHLHVLLPDGVFVPGADEAFDLAVLPPPEDEDVLRLAQRQACSPAARCPDGMGGFPPAILYAQRHQDPRKAMARRLVVRRRCPPARPARSPLAGSR
jgi:hypothetical protein